LGGILHLGTQRNEESTTEIKEQVMTKVKITADTSQAERKIKDLKSALKDLDKVSGLVGGALTALAAAGAGLAIAFKSVADGVGELADIGKALGMTAQQLGYLQQSAQLAGVGADELNAALFRLRGNIGDALVKGTGPANDALKRLGLSVKELSVLPADQQIAKITEQLRQIPNPAERSALAMDLLGKQGPRLLEVALAAKTIKDEAEAMGISLSDLDIRNFEKAGDAIDELTFIAQGVLKSALAELSPYIIAIAQSLSEAAKEGGGLGNIIRERVIPAIRLATQAMAILATFFVATKITAGVIAATAAMIKMYQAIKLATTASAMLNAVLGKNPLLKIAGAVAGLFTAAVVVDEIGDAFDELDKKAAAINANTQTELKKEAELRANLPPEVEKLNQEQEKARQALEDTIVKLEQSVAFERDKVKLGETQANINKMIAEESAKLQKTGQTLSEQAKQRITAGYQELQAIKESTSMSKVLESLETERLGITTTDKDLKEVVLAIRKQELEFNRKLTNEESESLRIGIQKNQQAKQAVALAEQQLLLQGLAKDLSKEDSIRTATGVIAQSDPRLAMAQDYATKKRAIDEAIANSSKQIDDGSFNTYKQLVAARNNLDAEYRDAKEIADLQFNDRELLRSQSHEEAKFQHKLKVLQAGYDAANAGVLQEKRLNDQSLQNEISLATAKIEIANREVLARQAIGEAILNMEQKVADARLKQAGVTNQAILASVKQNQANVAMIQQGGVVGMQGMLGAMMSVTGQMASTNKRAFETHKAMAMTQAIISTYQAAAMAIAFPPGPPLSFIYVAGAIAAGLAQVAAIRSQTFSGRALGGPVMGGKSYIVGESGPELFTPSTTGSITRNSDLQGGGVTNVNFTIVANDTTGFDQLLASRKGVIQQIISDAMLEKGRRSMV
jgi:hypothetical protein